MKRVAKPITGFDPSVISSQLAEAIRSDLSSLSTHVSSVDPASKRYTEMVYERSLLKKFDWDSDQESLRKAAFEQFKERMSQMRQASLDTARVLAQPDSDPVLFRALNRARYLAGWILGSFDTEEWYLNCRHSNGVTQGTTFQDTSLENKFSFPVSTTRALIPLFKEYLLWDGTLSEALFWANRGNASKIFKITECSRATTVPKSQDKARMIAIETTLGMFFQQGLMKLFYDRLAQAGLDVALLPTIHKDKAWVGSITAKLATIDFSSASDCVSTELVKWILPPDWFAAVELVRCSHIDLDGDVIELPIISTMGNATTFPIETLVFYCLAVASVMDSYGEYRGDYLGNPNRLLSIDAERSAVSVFGDDCILPTGSAKLFMSLCTKLGFVVNSEKSYYGDEGFRESCGGDYYHGRSVRPLFIGPPTADRKSALAPWLYSLFNRLVSKYITYFGPLTWCYDKKAIRYLFDTFRKHKLLIRIVPRYMPEDSGLYHFEFERLQRHYNFRYHPISTSLVSGISRFTYESFRYRNTQEVDDNLRYWACLIELSKRRDPGRLSHLKDGRELELKRSLRMKGGYFIASGFTTIW